MKREILTLLRGGGYVSGQDICRSLGVSRTAVWKGVNSLKEEGYRIEAVPNRGYRLEFAPDVLTEAEIGSLLTGRWAGRELEAHRHIGCSTNLRAKQLADAGAVHGTLVAADVQEGGKGRRGRVWEASPEGTAIAMSLILRPSFAPGKAPMLTLLAALAVRDGIRQTCGLEPGIKWPNDLTLGSRKGCGILTEMALEAEYIQHVVVGIGINVNQTEFPEALRDRAVSLRMEAGRPFHRAELLARILEAWEGYYETFQQTENLAFVQEDYNRSLAGLNGPVQVLAPDGGWEGISLGIDASGSLLVRRPSGQVEAVDAGEVSVRGLYGYV